MNSYLLPIPVITRMITAPGVTTLVVFFQRYEIGPRPLGYPMFPISIYDLQDIIDEKGSLGIMIGE